MAAKPTSKTKLPAKAVAKAQAVPKQITDFVAKGGWSQLAKPGVAQAYTQAIMKTAKNPHGKPHIAPGTRGTDKPSKTITKTTTTNPPPVTPFLTPAQQAAWTAYQTRNTAAVGSQTRRISDAIGHYGTSVAAAQRSHDISANNTNQALAARGLFQSSIRAGDLNDIDAQLVIRNNALNTAKNSIVTDAQSRIGTLGTNLGTTHDLYGQYAVTNAQAITPQTPTTTTTKVPNPAYHPAANINNLGQVVNPPAAPKPAGSTPGTILGEGTATWADLTKPGVAQGAANAWMKTAQNPTGGK